MATLSRFLVRMKSSHRSSSLQIAIPMSRGHKTENTSKHRVKQSLNWHSDIFGMGTRMSVRSRLPLFIAFLFFNVPSAFNVFRSKVSHNRNIFLSCEISGSGGGSQEVITQEEVEILVRERTQHRKERNYAAADSIKDLLNNKHGVEIIDYPQSSWKYIARVAANSDGCDSALTEIELKENLMWLARNAYYLLHSNIRSEDTVVQSALRHLRSTNASKASGSSKIKEMQGRKFADAAFEFSLAGVKSEELYNLLSLGATTEMKRYGRRNSCRPIDILQVVERFAVSGILNQEIYLLAANILRYKSDTASMNRPLSFDTAVSKLSSGSFSLFSDMPLLWLWRFSARQRKHGNQFEDSEIVDEEDDDLSSSNSGSSTLNSESKVLKFPSFHNPNLPLVVDIGCGFGVSMLGLSRRERMISDLDPLAYGTDFIKHNYIACDMSHRAISYARGISQRWGIDGNCQFVEADAVSFLELISEEYSGPIECVLINFPTPYQFGADSSVSNESKGEDDSSQRAGNAQLPKDMSDFMVTPEVIELCARILAKKQRSEDDEFDCKNDNNGSNGDRKGIEKRSYLLIQTNVEDVAVTIKNVVLGINGFKIPKDAQEVTDVTRSWHPSDIATAEGVDKSSIEARSNRGESSNIESCYCDTQESDSRTESDGNNNEETNYENNEVDKSQKGKENEQYFPVLKRAEKWIASGGERATGQGWLKSNPLPQQSRTETEAMCEHEEKPVHRILFFYG